jgi:hypothetical protein
MPRQCTEIHHDCLPSLTSSHFMRCYVTSAVVIGKYEV